MLGAHIGWRASLPWRTARVHASLCNGCLFRRPVGTCQIRQSGFMLHASVDMHRSAAERTGVPSTSCRMLIVFGSEEAGVHGDVTVDWPAAKVACTMRDEERGADLACTVSAVPWFLILSTIDEELGHKALLTDGTLRFDHGLLFELVHALLRDAELTLHGGLLAVDVGPACTLA